MRLNLSGGLLRGMEKYSLLQPRDIRRERNFNPYDSVLVINKKLLEEATTQAPAIWS